MQDRLQFGEVSRHFGKRGSASPDARQQPLHPLAAPQRVEQHQVVGHRLVGAEDRADGAANLSNKYSTYIQSKLL